MKLGSTPWAGGRVVAGTSDALIAVRTDAKAAITSAIQRVSNARELALTVRQSLATRVRELSPSRALRPAASAPSAP